MPEMLIATNKPGYRVKKRAAEKRIKNDAIGYAFPHGQFTDLTERLNGLQTDDQILAMVNELLAEQRKFAWDHERGGEMFHGAALVRTRRGRWFLHANIHMPNAETSRGCAENNSATEARAREGAGFEAEELWFMGGKANYEKGQQFLDNIGQRNTPC